MFLLTFLTVYGLTNWYITSRVFRMTPFSGRWRIPARVVWLMLVLSFPVGRICSNICRTALMDRLLKVGSWYLGAMVYSLFFFLLIDLAKLFFWLRRRTGGLDGHERGEQKAGTAFGLFPVYAVIMSLILTAGHYNAVRPVVRSYEITLPASREAETVKIALATDIHAGIMVNNHWLQRIVETINGTEPDMVLLAGDIVDGDVTHAQEERLSEVLGSLTAPLGAYAVAGNHEYYTDTAEALRAIESGGVEVLLDEARDIEGLFMLVGRKDIQAERFEGPRKTLGEILDGAGGNSGSPPVIVLDHTPARLEEAVEAGVSLQFSGHTHRGQLFPFNFITDAIFEQDWGFLEKGDTLVYVSCGVGTWGPPIRTNSRPEVVLFSITFDTEASFPALLP